MVVRPGSSPSGCWDRTVFQSSWRSCQTTANRSLQDASHALCEANWLTKNCHSARPAALFVGLSINKVVFEDEMIVSVGMAGSKLL